MNNKKPHDPLYPKGFEETKELKKEFSKSYPKPNKKDDEGNSNKKKDINKALLNSSNKMQYKKKLSSSSLNLYYSYNTNTNNTVNNQKESTPYKKTLIANLHCFDIPQEKLQLIHELPEIKDLRLEKEKQILKCPNCGYLHSRIIYK